MWKTNFPKNGGGHQKAILVLCGLSVVFYLLTRFVPREGRDAEKMRRASDMMAEAFDTFRRCRDDKGLMTERKDDPNQTGLIGLEFGPLTTSRGSLEAKRTTTNPNFAGLVVHLLQEAGVEEGDSIALGASGSFPALIVAALCAAEAMNLRALPIYSVGASQWGANETDFTWLHMESCLLGAGRLDTPAIAISLGGEKDIAKDWSPERKSDIESMAMSRAAPFLYESNLRTNVEIRMKRYEAAAAGDPIRAFINIGGAWANMGESPDVLKLGPGLVGTVRLPERDQRGVVYEMISRGIPVVHLLYIRGLSERYGLPWDPVPLPAPGEGGFYALTRYRNPRFVMLVVAYLFLTFLVLTFRRRFVDF